MSESVTSQQTVLKTPPPEEKPLPSVESAVQKWTKKIRSAKLKFDDDFKRMREDMEFVGGVQWAQQKDLRDDRYICNITLREVNQAVSALYARNPKAVAKRRERLDFAIWDEKQETLLGAAQGLMTSPGDPIATAIVTDYIQGSQHRAMLDSLAKTLEIAYQIQIDRQEPNFKLQMKQLVRRIKVTGVGYVRASFKREDRSLLSNEQTNVPVADRVKQAALLATDYEQGKFDENDAKTQQLKMLLNSVQYSLSNPAEVREQTEKLVFDFPSATSVIVDPRCRILKGFVGAHWIAQEYLLPLDEVKSFFERPDLKVGSGPGYAKAYSMTGEERLSPSTDGGEKEPTTVAVWEVFDKDTKARFFLCDGYENYLLEPEELTPCVQRFWPIISATFNDTETEPGIKCSIYPPSDVRLLTHPQKEINRSREGLRQHRRSNSPKVGVTTGALEDEDKEMLKSGVTQGVHVMEFKNLPPGTKVNDVLQVIQHPPIDPAMYDTAPLERDVLLTTGHQQANLGPITSQGTATEATISEQSRISSTGSEVDELDELLTEMARVGGEMMLREMTKQTILHDCGVGAVWPDGPQRDDLVDRVFLEVQAASSGRPNRGLQIANAQVIFPLILQAGGNPIAVVEELAKAYDEQLDVQKFFPIVPPMMSASAKVGQSSATAANTNAGPSAPQPAVTDAAQSNL